MPSGPKPALALILSLLTLVAGACGEASRKADDGGLDGGVGDDAEVDDDAAALPDTLDAARDGSQTAWDAGKGDAAAEDAGCIHTAQDRCPPSCWIKCAVGKVFDTYTCSCIVPGRCDNGWDLCDLDKPVCHDGKCVVCDARDTRQCAPGSRCDTVANICVTDCATPCAPGTERDYFTCECKAPIPCEDGISDCPLDARRCFESRCVQCTGADVVCAPDKVCDVSVHRCVVPRDAGAPESDAQAGMEPVDGGFSASDAEAGS